MKERKKEKQSGQVMILSVILIGSTLLVSSAISGLLTLYQLKQSNNVVNSTKAFFAAEGALEWQTFERIKNRGTSMPLFSNGATATSSVTENLPRIYIDAKGMVGNSIRNLRSTFFLY